MTPPILIAGFHRSGTSAVARGLHSVGVQLGDRLLGAEPANPWGHFEDEDVIALHDDLLSDENLTWKSLDRVEDRSKARQTIEAYAKRRGENAKGSPWGLKDPRILLFLDEWVDVVDDAVIVFVLRPPGPTIASLHRRHIRRHVDSARIDPSDLDFWREPDLGLRLWLHYHREALPVLRQGTHRLVSYGDDDQLRNMVSGLGLRGAPEPFDTSLGKHEQTWVIDAELIEEARELYAELASLHA